MERWRKHFPKTSTRGLETPFLHDGAQIHAIARTRERHVQEALGFLAIPVRFVLVGPRLEVTNRDGYILA